MAELQPTGPSREGMRLETLLPCDLSLSIPLAVGLRGGSTLHLSVPQFPLVCPSSTCSSSGTGRWDP